MNNSNLKQTIASNLKTSLLDNTINVNGKEYIEIDILTNLMREFIFNEALLGSILHKEGTKEISDEEILMYISERYENTEIKYDNGKYFLSNVK